MFVKEEGSTQIKRDKERNRVREMERVFVKETGGSVRQLLKTF
jgi:hypothetical protein